MKKNFLYVLAILVCLAVIAGLFGIVKLRSNHDSVTAVQVEEAEENDGAINLGRSDEEDAEEPEEAAETEEDTDAAETDETEDAAEAENTDSEAEDAATAADADTEDAATATDAAEGAEETEDAAEAGDTAEDKDAEAEGTATDADESAAPAEIGDLDASGAFYQKLAAGESINVLIVGDSIAYGTGATGDSTAWFTLLANDWKANFGSDCNITNLALNGNTTYGAYVTVEQLGDDAGDYDLVIVCSGQNDADDDLGLYYEVLLRSLYRHFPDCTVLSILESSQREVTEKITTITELSDHYGILTVDTITPLSDNYDALSDDGIHPNDDGQVLYAQAIEQAVNTALTEGRPADDADAEPVDSAVENYDETRWYDAADFRTDDSGTVLSATVTNSGVLGIVYGCGDSVAAPTVYLDGEAYIVSPAVLADTEIVQVGTDVNVEFELRAEFSDASQAALFQGVLFSK